MRLFTISSKCNLYLIEKDADRVLAEGHSLLHTRELRKLEKWRADFDLRIASGMSRQVDAETTNAPVATIRPARRGLSEIKVKRAEKETEKAKKKQTKMTIFNDANPAAADEHVAGLQVPKLTKNKLTLIFKKGRLESTHFTRQSAAKQWKREPEPGRQVDGQNKRARDQNATRDYKSSGGDFWR